MRRKAFLLGILVVIVAMGTSSLEFLYAQYAAKPTTDTQKKPAEARYDQITWSDVVKSGPNYMGYYATYHRGRDFDGRRAFILGRGRRR